mgnify:CR=1 FL=1
MKHSPQQGYISIISDPFVPTTSAFDNIIYKTTNNKDIENKFVMEKYEELKLLISELGDIKKVNELLYPYSNVEYEKKIRQDDVVIYIVKKEMCWATPSPCLSSNINVKKINGYNFFYP